MLINKESEEEEEEIEELSESRIPVSRDKMVVGFISFKGGSGKSISCVSTALLESAMNGNVCVVDADVLNATTTNMLIDLAGKLLRDSGGYIRRVKKTFIDYFLNPEEIQFVRLNFRRIRDISIPLPHNTMAGISVKHIRLIPAAWPMMETRFDDLLLESSATLRSNLHTFFNTLVDSMSEAKDLRLCIIDFPVFSEVQRQSLWVRVLIKSISSNINLVVFTEADTSSIKNMVNMISTLDNISGLKGKILGVVINKVSITGRSSLELLRKQATYIYRHLRVPVYVIPFDRIWAIKIRPPVIINPPNRGANLALTFMDSRAGILRREDLERVFKYDPEASMPSELKPEKLIIYEKERRQ